VPPPSRGGKQRYGRTPKWPKRCRSAAGGRCSRPPARDTHRFPGPLSGASRTRTGDLLGAIRRLWALLMRRKGERGQFAGALRSGVCGVIHAHARGLPAIIAVSGTPGDECLKKRPRRPWLEHGDANRHLPVRYPPFAAINGWSGPLSRMVAGGCVLPGGSGEARASVVGCGSPPNVHRPPSSGGLSDLHDILKFMNKINLAADMDRAVARLAAERPDWLPVLDAAVAVAEEAESYSGDFAGSWVVAELTRRGQARRIPNLRLLVSFGLIEKSGPSTRGGSRAYYRMPDRTGVANALKARQTSATNGGPRALRFIAAGASTEPPSDVARQAGEIRYEPRSWR
jgi:hypothetical protein